MIKEIKFNVIYRAQKGFTLFPQCVILLKKIEPLKTLGEIPKQRYTYYDIQRGEYSSYLTETDIKLAYEEWRDE